MLLNEFSSSGIKRIHDECEAVGVRVEFKRMKTGFVVSFYKPKWEEGEGLDPSSSKGLEVREKVRVKVRVKTGEKILRLLKENQGLTVAELADNIKISPKAVEWNLRQLKAKGRLHRVGPDKGGHWEVQV